MFESERVADLVDDLFSDSVGEDVDGGFRRYTAIRRCSEPVCRDDRAAPVEVREPEDVVPASVVQILWGDTDVLLAAADAAHDLDEVFGAVLVSGVVVRVRGDRLVVVDRHVTLVYRPKHGGGFPLHARGDLPDGHDVHEHGSGFDRPGHKPPAVGSPQHDDLIDALERYDRLLEVGVGNRPGVARELAARGCTVLAIDIDPPSQSHERGGPETNADDETAAGDGTTTGDGTLAVRHGDVVALAAADSAAQLDPAISRATVDAVYARRLPAELQRPTVALARRLDAACMFTTLGFEEPIVPVERRALARKTMYVVDDGARQ